MSENLPSDLMKPGQRGMLKDLILNLKLILRLMGDKRVNLFLKVLPIASLAYFVAPFDAAIPVVDDAAILWLGSYLFLELCPDNVVKEHRKLLTTSSEDQPQGEATAHQNLLLQKPCPRDVLVMTGNAWWRPPWPGRCPVHGCRRSRPTPAGATNLPARPRGPSAT